MSGIVSRALGMRIIKGSHVNFCNTVVKSPQLVKMVDICRKL